MIYLHTRYVYLYFTNEVTPFKFFDKEHKFLLGIGKMHISKIRSKLPS